MNKIQSILALFLVCFALMANAQYELKKEYAVYFESNSYHLNQAAEKVLTYSLAAYDDEQMTIRLQAFTDDVGSQTFNEKLAKDRAVAVQEYLLTKGIIQEQIEILASEQLVLNEQEDKAVQRQKNRRVAIQFWAKKGTGKNTNISPIVENEEFLLEDFFKQEQQQFEQFFSFNASLGTVIQGKKGTVIQIPPNALVRADGKKIEGIVSFTLQEAYSYGDMLLQNLNTTAQGKQLETGGMFFMKAVDASGTELKVKKGAQLKASLPTEEAKLAGMQTFNGKEDAAGNVDWVATNQAVSTTNYSFGNYRQICQNYKVEDLQKALKVVDFVPDFAWRLPRQITKPKFTIREPKQPRLKVAKPKKTKQELEELYPKRKQESNLGYYRRIIQKRSQLTTAYRKARTANFKKIREFNYDSTRYVRSEKRYEHQLAKYNNYDANMKEKLGSLQQHMTDFSVAEHKKNGRELGVMFRDVKKRYQVMSSTFYQLKMDLAELEKEGCEIQDLVAELDGIRLEEEQYYKINIGEQFQKLYSKNFSGTYSGYQKGYNSRWKWDKATKKVNKLMEKVVEGKKLTPYQLKRITESFLALKKCHNFNVLARKGKIFNSYYAKNKKTIDEFISTESKIRELSDKYQIRRSELGILSPDELAQMYGNVMNITAMGWINCDRFIEDDSPKMSLEILTEYNPNTKFYIMFEDIRSMISPNYQKGRGYVAGNLPSARNAKIIGITVVGQTAEVFMQEGTIAQLDEIKPVFETKSLREVRDLMDVQQ